MGFYNILVPSPPPPFSLFFGFFFGFFFCFWEVLFWKALSSSSSSGAVDDAAKGTPALTSSFEFPNPR